MIPVFRCPVLSSLLCDFCFRRQPDKLGWCGTCIKNAEEGTQGYCRPNEPISNNEDDLIVRVKKAQVYPQQKNNNHQTHNMCCIFQPVFGCCALQTLV